jgi:hypothetical protein
MNVDVSTEIVIDCPLATVSAYSADPNNVAAWYVNIKSVEWQTVPAIAVGARIAFVAQFLGRRMAYTYEIAELILASVWSCRRPTDLFRWKLRTRGSP